MRDTALTKNIQTALTPKGVLTGLLEGNERYIANNLTPSNVNKLVQQTIDGQFLKQ